MQIYFPIAEINANIVWIASIGLIAGMLSNIFGIGGGFIATPFLIAFGVPPYIATACATHQIIGSSFMGVLTKLKPPALDFKLAFILALFGIVGSYFGVVIIKNLQEIGHADILISFAYIIVMSFTAINILVKFFLERRHVKTNNTKSSATKLPFRVMFSSSPQPISIVVLGIVGVFVGILTGIMGIGGGFVMVPIMTYILKLDKTKIIGTSLMQICIITIFVTAMNIFKTHSVDLLLGTCLIAGGVIGSFVGSKISNKITFEYINFLLALLIICVSSFFVFHLVKTPNVGQMFTLEALQ